MNSQLSELQKRMSELNDEKLLQIVEVNFADYRQDALDCARQELTLRGIVYNEPAEEAQFPEEEKEEDIFHPELVTIATYTTPYEAQIAKGMLETNGIPAFAANEHFVGVNWLLSNAIGGVTLQVTETDAEQARALLAQENASTPLADEATETQPTENEKESRAPQMKTLARAMLFIVMIVMAIGGWNFYQPIVPPPHIPFFEPRASDAVFYPPEPVSNEELALRFVRTHTVLLAQCLSLEKTHLSFKVLETLFGEELDNKALKIAQDSDGKIFNANGYAEEVWVGAKTLLFLNPSELGADRIQKPVEFITVYYDEDTKKADREIIQRLVGVPMFFADTGEAYKDSPEYVPLKDFLFSLKKLR